MHKQFAKLQFSEFPNKLHLLLIAVLSIPDIPNILVSSANNLRFSSGKARARLQEAQLMLTNPRDAFRGQARSPNSIPFHMLGIFSSCAVTLLRRAVFPKFDFKKCRDLEIRVRGHSRSLKVVPFYRLGMVSY